MISAPHIKSGNYYVKKTKFILTLTCVRDAHVSTVVKAFERIQGRCNGRPRRQPKTPFSFNGSINEFFSLSLEVIFLIAQYCLIYEINRP
jgi:hypothetical protein